MSPTRKQVKDLQLIHSCPKAIRKQLLKKLSSKVVKTICECSLNVLKGNIPISHYQKKQLGKHKYLLRKLASKKGSLYQKKRLIIQKGGFLNILIPAAVTALSTLIHGV